MKWFRQLLQAKKPDVEFVGEQFPALGKIDAGATRAITQFFFDNSLYLRYVDRVRAAGIDIPIVPGVVCIQNFRQTSNFARKTGATVPDWLGDRFAGLENDPATHQLVAAGIAAEQVLDLVDQGIRDFHFYTMNRAELVYAICRLLGLKSEDERAAA